MVNLAQPIRRYTIDKVQQQAKLEQLIEDVGITFGELGLPRMAGRILGWLLICDPPYQSASELSQVVGGSKGSISSMTHLLSQVGLVERMGLPQNRVTYYRVKPGAWFELLTNRMTLISVIRQLAERGLDLIEKNDVERRSRLEEIHDLYAFFERELPSLLERWQRQRKESQPHHTVTRV